MMRYSQLLSGVYACLLVATAFMFTSIPAKSDIPIPPTCQGGSVTVCGVSIPMPGITSLGNTATVHVPPQLLGDSAAINPNLTFTAECVDSGNDTASYRVANMQGISCNAFPCQTSNVRLCDTSIPVPGGTPLGGVVHMSMPTPFIADPFTVQCIGTEGNPPVYQITDNKSVSCTTRSAQ